MNVWLALVAAFCIAGVVCIIRRIYKTSSESEEFRHAVEDGIVDSEEFPVEKDLK